MTRRGRGGTPRRLRWIYPYRSLRLTRDGWFFLVVTMAIGFASLNTGHNLFYLIFALQVSLIVVSGILSERALRGLVVERKLPRRIFARAAVAVELRVENRGRRGTAYVVEVRDGIDRQARRTVGFLDRLPPGASRSFHAVWSFESRGRHEFRGLHLVTRFPFGLFEKTRILPWTAPVVVYPSVESSHHRDASPDRTRAVARKHRLGEEMLGLRRMLPDDDYRYVHWRISARAGELMVREAGEANQRPVALFFDTRPTAGPAFEAAVERVAALLWHACAEGRTVDFYSHDFAARGLGRETCDSALAYLAEVTPAPASSEANFERWRHGVIDGGGVYVTSGEPPALPPGTCLQVA